MSDINPATKPTHPLTAAAMRQTPLSRIARRTLGQSHGPVTRLMSPSDFGRLLKPFVFLDLIDNQGKPFSGFGLHPHSGIATLTYVAESGVSYEDTNGAPDPMRSSYLARLSRMIATLSWAPTPCIRAPKRCVKPRRGSRRFRRA